MSFPFTILLVVPGTKNMENTIVLMLLTQGQGWDVEFWRVPKEIYQALKLVSFVRTFSWTELAITSHKRG